MIDELSTGSPPRNTEVMLSNGIVMKWLSFLNNASKYLLGTSNIDKENPPRKAEALDRMREIIGVIRINKKYFENPEYIGADLREFAKAGGIRIDELSTFSPP